jgi:ParB family chromosome partitioning protein
MNEETSLDPKKRGLGRGLNALFGEDTNSEKQNEGLPEVAFTESADQITTLPIEYIRPCSFQPRRHFDQSAIEELAKSIYVHGIIQPLTVRPVDGVENAYEIIAGERRWRAAQKVQLHEVPVTIQSMDDATVLEIALIENIQRENLSAIEEANAYQQLIEKFGHTQEKLAASLGKSRSHIANIMRLLSLPESVQKMIENNELSAGHARALIGLDNAEELANQIKSESLSVRDIERLAREVKEPLKQPQSGKNQEKNVNTLALEDEISSRLGMKISINAKANGKGTLKIDYGSLDQLDDVVHRLSTTPK